MGEPRYSRSVFDAHILPKPRDVYRDHAKPAKQKWLKKFHLVKKYLALSKIS